MIKHVVISNNGEARMWISSYSDRELWSNQNPEGLTFQQLTGSFGNIVFEGSLKECENYIKEVEESSTQYHVFYNRAENYGFVEKWNHNSGPLSQHGRYSDHGGFDTKEEAEKYLDKLEMI